MQNFSYFNPTRLIFGRGAENEVGQASREIMGRDGKVLVIYGGGTVKRTGLLNRVIESLEAAGLTVIEKGGVKPNPDLSFVRETVDWMRDQGVGLIVALGGGSVIDTAKAVAAGLEYEGDTWDFFDGRQDIEKALPVVAVLTLPAAGSEQSSHMVISHHGAKTVAAAECLRPRAAIIDPELFFTIPKHQAGAGIVDMMSHIMERYFSETTATDFVDAQAEAALRTIIEFGPKVCRDAGDYDAWCQIGLAGSVAHNGYFGLGRTEDWASHAIEHELSGWNDAIVHGMGLSVVFPAWMRYAAARKPARFAQFAVKVMGIAPQADDAQTAELGIAGLCGFFRSIGMPITLRELGAEDCPVESLARHCCKKGPVGRFVSLEAADVTAILASAA